MRVLIYLHSLESGGAERVAANLANHWVAKGWDVTIVTVAPREADFYELDPRIARIGLDMRGESTGIVTAIRRNFNRIAALRKALWQEKPDVALAMMSNANIVLALASVGMPKLVAIGSEHIYPGRVSLGAIWNALRRLTYGRLDAMAALTRECASWIERHAPSRRVPVIPNAAGWPLIEQPPRVDPLTLCSPERKVLLAVGRLCEQKHFDALIDAFSKIAARHAGWDLVILGKGPDRDVLQAQIDAAGMKSRIMLAGVVGNMAQWYARADLYAMSSRFEGFPNTLAEAMAHGLPVVSFDCDTGPRDIIRQDVDGLLVRPGDVPHLAETLDRVMGDDELRARFAVRAIDTRVRFSIERVSAMWEGLFRECMAGKVLSVSKYMTSERSVPHPSPHPGPLPLAGEGENRRNSLSRMSERSIGVARGQTSGE